MAHPRAAPASPASPVPPRRTAPPLHLTRPPPDRAGSQRSSARSFAMHQSRKRHRAAPEGRRDRPCRWRCGMLDGANRVNAVVAVSTASANAAASKPAAASWNEARFSTSTCRRFVRSRPCQTEPLGAPCRNSSMRCRRSDSGISRPARNARSASGLIQASAAVARCIGASPGASAINAAAALVSQAAGMVTERGGELGVGARHHAMHPHALPSPDPLHGEHAMPGHRARKAYFAVITRSDHKILWMEQVSLTDRWTAVTELRIC